MQNYNYRWNDKRQTRQISSELITAHAVNQIQTRLVGITDVDEVVDKVLQFRPTISKMKDHEQVMVVIRQLGQTISKMGSSGNLVVACVDPRTMTIKTVMLRFSRQMGKKVK